MASRSLTCIAPLVALTIAVGSAMAQQAALPECRHLDYRGNFRLNGAKNHLDLASKASTAPDVKRSRIADATRLLTDAARAGGADQASLWYMFGQLYALTHDLAGADSAFSKVEAVTDPECKRLIERERRNEWVPLQNQGVEQMNAGNGDSALTLFRASNRIYRSEPYSYLNMASIFFNMSQQSLDSTVVAEEAHRRGVADSLVRKERMSGADSAIIYFRLAARSSQDHRFDDARETALFNAARLVQASAVDTASVRAAARRTGVPDSAVKAGRLRDAEAAYREVLQMKPRDLPAQASLAGVLTALHREDEAKTVYDSMLAHADSMDAFDLMDAGTALFRSHRFPLAARAMEMGVAKNPCFRDGLYNLANVYLAGGDTVKLLGVARRLVAQDSMNSASLQVLARAWQDNGNKDSTLRVLQRTEALPWEMAVVRFVPGDTSASLHGMITNRRNAPQKSFTLTLQFLSASCEVVASQNVDLPDLNPNGNPGQSYDFNVSANGRGIVAWKYKPN
jgi:tetratricopeptide (TPR) repeat protein